MSDSPSLVERQVRERRQRILVAARRYVTKHGVDEINVRALAKACAISVPTIYRTFGSKEGLLSEAMQPFAEKSLRADAAHVLTGEGYERLLSLIELWSRGSAQEDDESAFVRAFLASDAGRKLAFRLNQQMNEEARSVLTDMRERGELVEWVDIEVIASRLTAQTIVASIECASGLGPAAVFRAAFVYACCLVMLGVTKGKAREAFQGAAARNQGLLERPRDKP